MTLLYPRSRPGRRAVPPLTATGLPVLALLLGGLAACGGDEASPALQVERDTVGDTVVVRTLAGRTWARDRVLEPEMRIGAFEGDEVEMLGDVNGIAVAPDGSIYLYDRQVPALRKYSANGEYVATFGREGGGPGEYKQSDGGLAVLADGRVLLRDPGNGRINVYSEDGESLDHWDLRGGYFTSNPLFTDTAGSVYTQIWGTGEDGERYSGLRKISPRGEPGDSLLAPEWEYEEASITFASDRMSMRTSVPFSPQDMWTFSPFGYYVGGLSTTYTVDLFRPDGTVLRIQREVDPVPVHSDEAANRRQRITADFRQLAPDWSWNGPSIPDTKPPFTSIRVGSDGRIWVALSMPGEPIPAEELSPSDDPNAPEPLRWREPTVFDVFETDGTYLGQVRAPGSFSRYPYPIFGADHVWAITTDDLDVEYLTRFRIARPEPGAAGE